MEVIIPIWGATFWLMALADEEGVPYEELALCLNEGGYVPDDLGHS